MSLLIHIGYHKTGSTFLQKQVFNQENFGFISPWCRQDYYEKLLLVNPFLFDINKTRLFFEEKIEKAAKENLVSVISEERLSGSITSGGYNNYDMANKLYSLFPQSKILIIIRNQLDMIWSIYKHRLNSDLTVGINEYLEQIQKEFPSFEPFFNFDYLQYHWLINHYQSLFGKDQVLVLPYEMLKDNKVLFLEKISNFTKTNIDTKMNFSQVNKSYSYLSLYFKRWTNFFAPRICRVNSSLYQKINNSFFYRLNQVVENTIPEALIQKVENHMKEIIAEKIHNYYIESNQKTSNIINMDLSLYNYQME
ncbi:MAG: sulfotransferase [Cyanobacteria bacterium]|nr:sulfotransferase [Cyanobacteria bacterium CG_2015-16_32_12]NCO78843.1 sulfotransferase [Cyanobacteria bacterium CG_2015-22_32_23]NCQ04516.1 sulfotransferase [Cyanobacteria bacterium CG_2015-09_32_10]NCQ40448.1 sulfotransferase [Cyanobacteria bacterium CG_2015-04_32_10]